MHSMEYGFTDSIVSLSSLTCADLGIPCNAEDSEMVFYSGTIVRPSAITLDRCTYEPLIKSDPFSPMSLIPMPNPFNGKQETEPAFITKRNERERERVRCVNEGYARLRTHIPLENKEKRISKVETLRAAIQYIKELENILANDPAERPKVKTQHEKKSNHVTRIKGRREHEHSKRLSGPRRKTYTSDKT